MASQHRYRVRALRGIPEDLWQEFERAAKEAGTNRSALARQFMEWHVGRPSAKLPARPKPKD